MTSHTRLIGHLHVSPGQKAGASIPICVIGASFLPVRAMFI